MRAGERRVGLRGGVTALARDVVAAADPVEVTLGFVALPTVLAAVHHAPGSTDLALDLAGTQTILRGGPVLRDAFTMNYVHASPAHLWSNIRGLWWLLLAIYPLALLAGAKRALGIASLAFLTVGPFVVAEATVRWETGASVSGFSGIGSAFAGLLLVLLFAFVGRELAAADRPTASAALLFGATAAGALLYNPELPPSVVPGRLALVVACALIGVAVVFRPAYRWGRTLVHGAPAADPSRELAALLVYAAGIGVLVTTLVNVFGVGPAPARTNFAGHFAGYAFGFVVSIALLRRGPIPRTG